MQGGTALLAFIAVICVHSMLLLVKAKQYTCDSEGITRLSYGGLVRVLSCTVCARVRTCMCMCVCVYSCTITPT